MDDGEKVLGEQPWADAVHGDAALETGGGGGAGGLACDAGVVDENVKGLSVCC